MKSKTDDQKIKVKKDESKYKSDDLRVKGKKDETKYKSEDLKMKDDKGERKVKAKVRPMTPTTTEQTEIKTGETNVRTKEHIEPVAVETVIPAPVVDKQAEVPKNYNPVTKPTAPKYAARKTTTHKRTPAPVRKPNTGTKYIVRTKVVRDTLTVRDTVLVPSPPERIVSTQTEYVRDTVVVTRVDTVEKKRTENTYNGYPVPRGDFKKVKLKKDNSGEVQMKTK